MCQWKKPVYRLSLFLFIFSAYLVHAQTAIAGKEVSLYKAIDEAILSAAQVPPVWNLEKEIRVDEPTLNKFEQIYGIKVQAIINQVFAVNLTRVQINYCLVDSESTAEVVVLKMKSLVGNANIIFKKANIAIELISEDAWLKQEALKLIRPGVIHKVLVQKTQLPGNWTLRNIILVEKSKIPFFESKLGARIDTIFNQVFKMGTDLIRINYISGSSGSETEKLYQNMKKGVAGNNIILTKENVVIEIIAKQEPLKHQAAELF